MTSLGLRAVRERTSSWAVWKCRPTIVSMSRPASGLRFSRLARSLRSISMARVGSTVMAVVMCGEADSIEARPNISPAAGESITTSWLSSSMTRTLTWPLTATLPLASRGAVQPLVAASLKKQ